MNTTIPELTLTTSGNATGPQKGHARPSIRVLSRTPRRLDGWVRGSRRDVCTQGGVAEWTQSAVRLATQQGEMKITHNTHKLSSRPDNSAFCRQRLRLLPFSLYFFLLSHNRWFLKHALGPFRAEAGRGRRGQVGVWSTRCCCFCFCWWISCSRADGPDGTIGVDQKDWDWTK